jgi:hypothetical protein
LLKHFDRASGGFVQNIFILCAVNVQRNNIALNGPRSPNRACDTLTVLLMNPLGRTWEELSPNLGDGKGQAAAA